MNLLTNSDSLRQTNLWASCPFCCHKSYHNREWVDDKSRHCKPPYFWILGGTAGAGCANFAASTGTLGCTRIRSTVAWLSVQVVTR